MLRRESSYIPILPGMMMMMGDDKDDAEYEDDKDLDDEYDDDHYDHVADHILVDNARNSIYLSLSSSS